MKKINLRVLILCVAAFCNVALAQTKLGETAKMPSYEELVAKLKGGDTRIDYKSLRMAYTETKDYSPYGTGSDKTNGMFQALSDKKYKEALKLADEILKTNYVEMNSHLVSAEANDALGNKEQAEFHKAVFLGLMNSIIGGRDGKSVASSYEVISVPEEYVIMFTLGYKVKSQGLINKDGHKFDLLSGVNTKTNETTDLYFNIDTVFKGYGKIFGK